MSTSRLDNAYMLTARRTATALTACLALFAAATIATACTTTEEGAEPSITPSKDGGEPNACPALDEKTVTTGPTVHEGDIEGVETWAASASPHVIKGDVNVRNGAKLVIEPCARVQFVAGASLNVAYPLTPNQGELVAEGTAERPIRFEGQDGARWNHVFVHAPGKARFAHVTFVGGGGGDTLGHETIGVMGDNSLPRKEILFVDNVTIEGSRGAGVRLDTGAAFAPGSKALTIKGSGTDDPQHPYPIELGESAVGSVPEGTYTGNAKDEILIAPETVDGGRGFQVDTTMRSYGVPWHVGNAVDKDDLFIGNGNRDAILTIEPGVKIVFEKGAALRIESDDDGTSAIRALGTADKPVVFSSTSPTPAAGDWRGLYFTGPVSADNALEHVRIEYTGADCHCSMITCSAGVSTYEAAIIFAEEPKTMFLKNSTLAHGAGHGVVAGYHGATFDWSESNTFDEIALCPVTRPVNVDTSCPDPRPACK